MMIRAALLAAVFVSLPGISAAAAELVDIVMEDAMVRGDDSDIEIFVRNKHLRHKVQFSAERTLVFVHGATYPAETSFDLRLGGLSWMDYIASRGFDVYLLDI